MRILQGLAPRYEEHHGVRYTVPALKACVDLSVRHLNDRFLPDKAIDVMDETGAAVRLRPAGKTRKTVGVRDVEEVVARMANIPAARATGSDRERLENLEADLKAVVFGQDAAIATVVRAVKRGRAGLSGPDRPIGSFLFTGPTGVGKTELSKQLAKSLGVPFLRFDMSEYMEKHSVSRLIGAPPGYVGYDQGGLLIERHPQAALRGAAARRDREGPPGRLRHPAAGDGSRDPDRQPGARGRLPPRDAHHDLQRRGPRDGGPRHRLRQRARGRRAQGDRAALQPRVPQSPRRDRALRIRWRPR